MDEPVNDDAVRREALDRLAATDTALVEAGARPRSLEPRRAWATSLRSLGEALIERHHDAALVDAFTAALIDIARAQQRNFPDNIFGDLDGMAGEILRDAVRSSDPAGTVAAQGQRVVDLQNLYGVHGAIRFRYAHDFLYGWDWAKWVAKDPPTRADVGPFDESLLRALEQRGHELVQLIERNDERYPTLAPHEHRNPFAFSRVPADEAVLMSRLAETAKVPVETWRIDPRPQWNRPFAALRKEEAANLGLVRRKSLVKE